VSAAVWFNVSRGVAGDMILGSLLDAGADLVEVQRILELLELEGWTLSTETVSRGSLRALRALVTVDDDDGRRRSYKDIKALLERSALPDRIAKRSGDAFLALATAEATIHQCPLDEVHFHEVGGHDAIIDIVGSMAALELLGADEVSCSAVGVGQGSIWTAHGLLPGPAPATLSLLEGFAIKGSELNVELATPTGAAILRALCHRPSSLPLMHVVTQGFGAGARELDGQANVVTAVVGTLEAQVEQVGLVETTIDDVSGELLGAAVAALLERGALDAWVTSARMKKGRPGVVLSALVEPDDLLELAQEVTVLTGSLGVRMSMVDRLVLDRSFSEVEVLGQKISIKSSAVRSKPEFADLERAAAATGRSITTIEAMALAEFARRDRGGSDEAPATT